MSAAQPTFHILPAHASEAHLSIVRSLFTAYTNWLDLDLTFQNYAAELAALPGAYAPPFGALLLAFDTDSSTPLGVIALRPLMPPTTMTAPTRARVIVSSSASTPSQRPEAGAWREPWCVRR
jgi:hypothetical protein